jgi:hypothetical protein
VMSCFFTVTVTVTVAATVTVTVTAPVMLSSLFLQPNTDVVCLLLHVTLCQRAGKSYSCCGCWQMTQERSQKLRAPLPLLCPCTFRYAPGDPVEEWLNNLLCLDAASHLPKPPVKLPHPDSCELFYVERDTLFSFHKASEAFLQRVRSEN